MNNCNCGIFSKEILFSNKMKQMTNTCNVDESQECALGAQHGGLADKSPPLVCVGIPYRHQS